MDNVEIRRRISEMSEGNFISIKDIQKDNFYYIADDYNSKFVAGVGVMLCNGEVYGKEHDVVIVALRDSLEIHPLSSFDDSIKVVNRLLVEQEKAYEEPKRALPLRTNTMSELIINGMVQVAEESYRFRRTMDLVLSDGKIYVRDQKLITPTEWETYSLNEIDVVDGIELGQLKPIMGIFVDAKEFLGDYSFFNEHFKVIDFNSYDGKRYHTAPRLHAVTSIPEFYLGERRMPSGTVVKRLEPPAVKALAQHEINNFKEDDIVVAWAYDVEFGLEVLDSELKGNFIKLDDLVSEDYPDVVMHKYHRCVEGVERLNLDELFAGSYLGAFFGPHKLIFEFTSKKCSLVYYDTENDKTLRIPLEFVEERVLFLDPAIQQKVDDFIKKNSNKANSAMKKSSLFS